MIRLQRSLVGDLDTAAPTPDAIRTALQNALELEHATIPLYLYALYSLDAEKNATIASIIQSVVVEEMLHMVLAANVLNAIGGTPDISSGCFVPDYPSALPGDVDAGHIFHLAPFSTDQLAAFLDIEQPEDELKFTLDEGADAASITIGQFYGAISKAIATVGDSLFVKPARNQVGPDLMPNAIVVTDVASATSAITTIVEQGEGTSTSPDEVVGSGYAHFYRFQQIAKGALLVKNPTPAPGEPAYSFSGDPVPFDATGVYAVPTDPKASKWPVGSAGRRVSDCFNDDYNALLAVLHDLCNGHANDSTMNVALGLMMSLKSQAKAMMSGIPNPAVLVGPGFEQRA